MLSPQAEELLIDETITLSTCQPNKEPGSTTWTPAPKICPGQPTSMNGECLQSEGDIPPGAHSLDLGITTKGLITVHHVTGSTF